MKTILGRSLVIVALLAASHAGATVGYYLYRFYPGTNFFCAGLLADYGASSNRLDELFGSPLPPDGTTISLWDPGADAFGQTSTCTNGVWTTNFVLPPGTGARLITGAIFTNTFVGKVLGHDGEPVLSGDLGLPPVYTGPDGVFLLGDKAPVTSMGAEIFTNILGRGPDVGEKITRFNPVSQTFVTSTYLGAGNWDIVPTLNVGEAAFFTIGTPLWLNISIPAAGKVLLSWSTNPPGYSLQSAAQLTAAAWLAVTNVPVVSNANYTVTLDQTNSQWYFRLQK
jgi:hypothetical protein